MMPVLDITDLSAPWMHLYVVAVMMQPEASAEVHQRTVDEWRAASALQWRRDAKDGSENAQRILWQATKAEPINFERRFATAYAKQTRYNRGRMAGRILQTALAKPTSLQQAYRIFYDHFNCKIKGISRNSLHAVWSDYKTVAHLWAALERASLPAGLLRGTQLADFLGAAEGFRAAGEAHRSQTGGGHLLAPEWTWRPPANLCIRPWLISGGEAKSAATRTTVQA